MTGTKAEALAEAEAALTAALDQAQQRYRAAVEAPFAAWIKATEGPRAELEAADLLARQVYAETVNAINTPGGANRPLLHLSNADLATLANSGDAEALAEWQARDQGTAHPGNVGP